MSHEELLTEAAVVVQTAQAGTSALGEIATTVLDGLVDQLREEIKNKDSKAAAQTLKVLEESVESREIALNTAIDQLKAAK